MRLALRARHLAILLATFGAVAGCTGIRSLTFDEGVVYFLPRTVLTITVTQYNDKVAGRTWYQIGGYKPGSDPAKDAPTLAEIVSDTIPDIDHRYVAKYRPSPMHDDRLCISRTKTGLLQDVHFASDDRTSEVVFNIARFIAGSIGGERKTGVTVFDPNNTDNKPIIRAYTGRLDPLNTRDIAVFNEAMRQVFGEKIEIDFSRMTHLFREHTAALPKNCLFGFRCNSDSFTDRCGPDNICYRTQLEVPIDLKRNGQRVDVTYASVINPWDIGAISATRALLVQKVSKFKFEKGVLIGMTVRKPSEIEELSLLPLHVLYAALHTPSAALATAFSSNDANKIKVAEQLATLTEKVNNNTSKVKELQTGLNPTTIQSSETYDLNCAAPGPSGTLINIVSGAKIN